MEPSVIVTLQVLHPPSTVNTRCQINVGPMLDQHRRWWASKPILLNVFAGQHRKRSYSKLIITLGNHQVQMSSFLQDKVHVGLLVSFCQQQRQVVNMAEVCDQLSKPVVIFTWALFLVGDADVVELVPQGLVSRTLASQRASGPACVAERRISARVNTAVPPARRRHLTPATSYVCNT